VNVLLQVSVQFTGQNAVLKDSTMMGEKQQEVDLLTKHLKENSRSLNDMSNAMESLHEENKQLAERIMILNESIEEQVADRIAQERESARILHKKLESAMSRNADEEHLRLEVEKRMADLQRENDSLSHWKVVYENGHGLQELARHQKKMKEDQRRLEMIIEKMSVQFSEVTEAKDLIEQSFMRLKEETGI
jgi:myosin heavy subunit